jgi:hypothetical protein
MRRCKELLTTEKDRCRDVLDVLRWAVKFRHYGVMSTLCYLAGRIAIASLTRTAMLLLEDVKRLLDDTGEVSTTIDVPLLQRTVYVSLASLGHENAAQEYIDRLVKKPSWDALNRGFHMEYYGDREYDPSRPIHRDDLRACPRTARALIDRFSSENGMRDIEFYTFCSLVRHRHAARAPIPVHDASDIIRARLPRVASPSIRAYANSTLEELSIPLFSPGHVIDQMYQLKHFRRSGWNYRDDARTRNVDNAESIADHMYAAYLLAFMLLPRSDPNPEYSKTRVCQMLLFHDIGKPGVEMSRDGKREQNTSNASGPGFHILPRWQCSTVLTRMSPQSGRHARSLIPTSQPTLELLRIWTSWKTSSSCTSTRGEALRSATS